MKFNQWIRAAWLQPCYMIFNRDTSESLFWSDIIFHRTSLNYRNKCGSKPDEIICDVYVRQLQNEWEFFWLNIQSRIREKGPARKVTNLKIVNLELKYIFLEHNFLNRSLLNYHYTSGWNHFRYICFISQVQLHEEKSKYRGKSRKACLAKQN